jgi:hypothetical protein
LTQNNLSKLHPFSQHILAGHPVRKKAAQKEAFRGEVTTALQQAGWPVQVESSGGAVKSHNIVVGDVKTARVIFTAHYDTPAVLPFPNFLAPRNLIISMLYQVLLAAILVAIPFLGVAVFVWLWRFVLPPPHSIPMLLILGIFWILLMLAMLMLYMGPANKSNANDNTSGALTLLEIAFALPAELRNQVALVFFDNEELGLVGSAVFRKTHGELKQTPLLNFDCVGDGDTLLFVQKAAVRKDAALQGALAAAFLPGEKKALYLDTSPLTFYPSDQYHFKKGIGVAAMRKAPLVGLYVARIHTRRDTVLDADNLLYLRDGVIRFVQSGVGIDN